MSHNVHLKHVRALAVLAVTISAACGGTAAATPPTSSPTAQKAAAPATRSTVIHVAKESKVTTASGTTVTVNGISLTIPTDWTSTSSWNRMGTANMTVASSQVVTGDGGLGKQSQRNMGSGDVLIAVDEYTGLVDTSGWTPIDQPPQVSADEVGSYATPAPALINQFYEINGRYLQVAVAFGDPTPTDAQLSEANNILSSLQVAGS